MWLNDGDVLCRQQVKEKVTTAGGTEQDYFALFNLKQKKKQRYKVQNITKTNLKEKHREN